MRWGARLNDTAGRGRAVGALTDPFEGVHMGVTAENVARKWNITREAQDELAVESHRTRSGRDPSGKFTEQIVPIEIKVRAARSSLPPTNRLGRMRHSRTLRS